MAARLLREGELPSTLLPQLEARGVVQYMEAEAEASGADAVFGRSTSLRVLFDASMAKLRGDGGSTRDALALEVAEALAFFAPDPPMPMILLRR